MIRKYYDYEGLQGGGGITPEEIGNNEYNFTEEEFVTALGEFGEYLIESGIVDCITFVTMKTHAKDYLTYINRLEG